MPLTIPKFANENEEADWWYENREQLAEGSLANVEGRKRRTGTAMKMAMAAQAGLKLTPNHVHQAHDAASRMGLSFADYLTKLVVEALKRETAA